MMRWALALLGAGLAGAQTRGILPEEVVKARPAVAAAPAPKPAPRYQPVAGTPKVAQGRQIGVTVWRLRTATAADTGVRILVQGDAQTAEWIPERVASTSRLRPYDRVRLTVESPESGFLYVIDREQYASGAKGEAKLIFPTTHTNGGNNEVAAGRLIDIPAQDDRPNFFFLRPTRSDLVGEELVLILTPAPLPDIQIGPEAISVSEAQLAAWEQKWGAAKAQVYELSGGAGQAWSRAEQMAAASRTRILSQDDPPPQTVYRVAAKAGEPIVVKVRLRL